MNSCNAQSADWALPLPQSPMDTVSDAGELLTRREFGSRMVQLAGGTTLSVAAASADGEAALDAPMRRSVEDARRQAESLLELPLVDLPPAFVPANT